MAQQPNLRRSVTVEDVVSTYEDSKGKEYVTADKVMLALQSGE